MRCEIALIIIEAVPACWQRQTRAARGRAGEGARRSAAAANVIQGKEITLTRGRCALRKMARFQ